MYEYMVFRGVSSHWNLPAINLVKGPLFHTHALIARWHNSVIHLIYGQVVKSNKHNSTLPFEDGIPCWAQPVIGFV